MCRYGCRSALEDAAKEDGHDELHDSDDDLLESSEEEEEDDDDLTGSPQRMPEPGAVNSAQRKDPSAFGSPSKTSACNVSSNNPMGSEGAADGSNGTCSRTRTAGTRPSVAFKMQEMEGRPSVDDGPTTGAESGDDAREQSGSLESKDHSGNTEKSIREYMVSEGEVLTPLCLWFTAKARTHRFYSCCMPTLDPDVDCRICRVLPSRVLNFVHVAL